MTKRTLCFLPLFLLLWLGPACAENGDITISSLEDLKSKRIGVQTGTTFDEIVLETLIPTLAQPDIQTVIEYSETEESAVLTVRYNGPSFDVTAKGEALSLKVLRSAVSDMAYTWDENAERPNQAVLRIRTA